MLNKWIAMGNVVRDVELRRTPSGAAVATITIAVERDFKGQDGNKESDFVDCVLWNKTAEFAAKYLSKGRRVIVEGSLQSRKWNDKSGNSRMSWEVHASNVYFADSKREEQKHDEPQFTEEDEASFGELPF